MLVLLQVLVYYRYKYLTKLGLECFEFVLQVTVLLAQYQIIMLQSLRHIENNYLQTTSKSHHPTPARAHSTKSTERRPQKSLKIE